MEKRIANELIEIANLLTAGCDKLPEGPMRDNCEKKKEEGDDKKASRSRRAKWEVEWFPATGNKKRVVKNLRSEKEVADFIKGENIEDADDLMIFSPDGDEYYYERGKVKEASFMSRTMNLLAIIQQGYFEGGKRAKMDGDKNILVRRDGAELTVDWDGETVKKAVIKHGGKKTILRAKDGDSLFKEVAKWSKGNPKTASARARVAWEPTWDDEFEIGSFAESYGVEGQHYEITSEDDWGDNWGVLTRKFKGKLKRTYKAFLSENPDFDRLADEVAKEMEKWINTRNVSVTPGEGETEEQYEKALKSIKVTGDFEHNSGHDYYAMVFYLELDGERVTFEPEGFYYRDNGDALEGAIREWEWARWLGDIQSPLISGTFRRVYSEIEAYRWFEDASEWQHWDLVEKVQELLEDAGYEPEEVV